MRASTLALVASSKQQRLRKNVPCVRFFKETGLQATKMEMRSESSPSGIYEEHDWYTYIFVWRSLQEELIDSPEGTLEWVPYYEI